MSPLEVYALCIVALFLKMFAVVLVQGHYRLRHRVFTKSEDAAYWGDGQVADEEHPVIDRAQRILRNDLENIPIFLFLTGAYVALEAWSLGMLIYGGLFVASRVVHTLTYLRPTQPLRNRAYLVGVLVCLVVSGHIIYEVVAA